jgi:hypothetical protein
MLETGPDLVTEYQLSPFTDDPGFAQRRGYER